MFEKWYTLQAVIWNQKCHGI